MLRKVRDAEEARGLLDAAEESGLARADWARRQGIDPRSLNAWRLNLGWRSGETERPVRLVELVPSVPGVPAARYVIRVGNLAVEVDDRFDSDTLARLLGVVAAC
jgi:hypothetical protein